MKVLIARAAAADLDRLRLFLADREPATARRATAVLRNAVQSLETLSDRGRPSTVAGLRELIVPFGRAAYVIRYAFFSERNEIVVVRIWHSRELRQ